MNNKDVHIYGPQSGIPGATNAVPFPPELRNENFKSGTQEYVHYQAANGLYLDINPSGWAFWSGSTHAIFSKRSYVGGTYLVYEYGNTYTGQYLSYKNNGYMCMFPWGSSVAWNSGSHSPLKVKGETWKTYEYDGDQAWIIIGDYDYLQIDLFEKPGF